MTNLTEQWKKGELPSGMYYIEFKDGDIAKDVYTFGSWGNINEHFLKQVLAPVPSYDHFVELTEKVKENQQLKELLKECKPYISYSINKNKYLGWTPSESNILTKIDNAIGEKNNGN